MRRTDRLFDLIQILRDGRLHRASEIAEKLDVSVRTIWRDMATLMASGMPVEGERGVGYILRAPITLPPMILSGAELEALRLGLRLVAEGEDIGAARAARSLAGKLASVTPAPPEEDELFAYTGENAAPAVQHIPILRTAIRQRHRLAVTYIDLEGREIHSDIRPLALEMAGRIWVLIAWCEARQDFRNFRIDRFMVISDTGETYPVETGRELADFRAMAPTGA